MAFEIEFNKLKNELEGDLYTDNISTLLYSTDASAYKETPLAVVRPRNNADIQKIILFAQKHKIGIIPRTAGTSLAGQVVGNGIVVDVSKYMTNILEVNTEDHWVRLQPGVVLDELNLYLKHFGLFFGPETSTSNRCMIGGMVGNNACGAHSLIYGSTRDHTLSLKGFLSDGSEVVFESLTKDEFEKKSTGRALENQIYSSIKDILSNNDNQQNIRNEFPEKELKRRNTGYALDLLLESEPFTQGSEPFNFCKLIAGSEGTLMFITEIKLNLVPLPPKEKGLVCIHFNTLEEAMQGNLIALKYNPGSIELIDDIILQCTKDNIEQRKNRFFLQGDPGAVIVVEFARETKEEIEKLKVLLEQEMREARLGYYFPLIIGADMGKVWALRKAALGLLSNIPGDAKPVSLVEDTAVLPQKLPMYIADFKLMLAKYNLKSVYHAHIATGELHLRPVINIKTTEGLKLFRTVATETAYLVKKYKGSLSGEHGDGRLRGEFIPIIIGDKNYNLLKQVKASFDKNNIFNPGKIVNTPAMDSSLRFEADRPVRDIETYFDFSDSQGFIRHTERCNGSGDCRKSEIIGGTMCPSYQATRDEKLTTRARANVLREFITYSKKKNPFDHKEIYEVLDLCLSCKACKSECPSNVDMAKLKAEFLQHYYLSHGVPLRTMLIANITSINKLGSVTPAVFNFFVKNKALSGIIKASTGFAAKRSIPALAKTTLIRWTKNNLTALNNALPDNAQLVYLFVDEFTNYNDFEIGKKAILLLNKLGYRVEIPKCKESGRTFLSKGLLIKAKSIAITNVESLKNCVGEQAPLIGIEPSAILTFRDEYPELVPENLKEAARSLAKNTFMIDEFLAEEIDKGNITKEKFTQKPANIKLHGHCQQKSIASTIPTKIILSLPENYKVEEIPSGCCGMAGSFGYEKEHYDLSMKIGELVLFPAIRNANTDTLIAAPGNSCRHQIHDGTQVKALHPVEILFNALL
jgi:FAD/FMN-containing dehydrogenase/Fe-S oxidoreductase